ncbi:MAG: hypothetical protein DYG89_02410 [Caldilinea sp. CFX5]|nr:hypothetical protein [Caldilinea sp. CFX5]
MSERESFCPYVGLQPYTEEEREYFFGREEDQETIAANLVTAPLTILYGASGVGKTSVLLAGVVPYLRTLPNITVVVFRTWQDRTFLASLKACIADTIAKQTGQPFAGDDAPLDEFLAHVADVSHSTLALIFDQFEEYFLYHPEADLENQFDAEFARAVNRGDIDANFLLAIREDSLALLDRFQRRIPNLYGNYLRLEHLDRPAAIRAIRKPLERYNERRTVPGEQVDIEDGLVTTLIEQVKTEPQSIGELQNEQTQTTAADQIIAPVAIETPLLQMILTYLWDAEMAQPKPTPESTYKLRLSTLQQLGDAKQIVQTYLDDEMNKLSIPEQKIAAHLFRYLVTPSGTKIALPIVDLISLGESPPAAAIQVLKKLEKARVLRPLAPPLNQPDLRRYEIFHDVLARAITKWRTQLVQAQETAAAEEQAAKETRAKEQELARQRELAQSRELAAVQALRASEQTQAAATLRKRALLLTVVSIVAFIAALAAGMFGVRATEEANRAATSEAQAIGNANLASTRAAVARSAATAAAIAHANAESEATRAAIEKATASAAQATTTAIAGEKLTGLENLNPGVIGISGASSQQFGYDMSYDGKYYGAFSWQFLQAMRDSKADRNANGFVSLREAVLATWDALLGMQTPDIVGNKREMDLALFSLQPIPDRASVSEVLLESQPAPEVLHVLLIGVSKFEDSDFEIRGPLNDVRLFEQLLNDQDYVLAKTVQIQVLLDTDATMANIREALTQMASAATPSTTILCYFSGISKVTNIERGGSTVLTRTMAPFDYNTTGGISVLEMGDFLAGSQAQHKVLIIDG